MVLESFKIVEDTLFREFSQFNPFLGNKNKGKYSNTQLPQGWTNIPRQKYLKRKTSVNST